MELNGQSFAAKLFQSNRSNWKFPLCQQNTIKRNHHECFGLMVDTGSAGHNWNKLSALLPSVVPVTQISGQSFVIYFHFWCSKSECRMLWTNIASEMSGRERWISFLVGFYYTQHDWSNYRNYILLFDALEQQEDYDVNCLININYFEIYFRNRRPDWHRKLNYTFPRDTASFL